jgi:hypothetical protein
MSYRVALRRPLLLAITTLCTVGLACGAVAAQASAATITANQACYVNANPFAGAPMTITGAGFTPGDSVDVSGGTVFTTATVNPDGTFAATTEAPTLSTVDPATETTTLTAQDLDGVTASTTVLSANLAVSATPSMVRHPDRTKVTFRFSGFTPGRHIYAYYVHNKKLVAKATFGTAAGACGTFSQKALLYPGGHAGYDQYTVRFESSSHYSTTAFPAVIAKLSMFRF